MAIIKIHSYNDAVSAFARARDKAAGRPLNTAFRLFQQGDDYIIHSWSTPVCRITPDNVVEFLKGGEYVRRDQSITSSITRVIPLHVNRVGPGRYRIAHHKDVGQQTWHYLTKEAPELFAGIKFDMETGACINQRPDYKQSIVPAARKTWLRDIKKFKRGMRARIKIGALDGFVDIANTEWEATRWGTHIPTWSSTDGTLDMLEAAIRTGEYSQELLLNFARTADRYNLRVYPRRKVLTDTLDRVCNSTSTELRGRYGVFGDRNE